jgi:hypothetical protein
MAVALIAGLLALVLLLYLATQRSDNAGPGAAPQAPPQPTRRLAGGEKYAVQAVGESRYLDAFEAIFGARSEEGISARGDALLVREPSNPYDANAVAVHIEGRHVAYLSREDAIHYGPMIGDCAVCAARVTGGWNRGDGDAGHFGVRLDLPPREVRKKSRR